MQIGLASLLGVVFIVLKLMGITAVATWSWVWVLAPFWIGFAIWMVVIVFGLILATIASR